MAGATNRMLELVEAAKDERDAAVRQRDRLLEAIDGCKYAEESDHQMRGSKAYLTAQLEARDRLYRTAAAIESEVGK